VCIHFLKRRSCREVPASLAVATRVILTHLPQPSPVLLAELRRQPKADCRLGYESGRQVFFEPKEAAA